MMSMRSDPWTYGGAGGLSDADTDLDTDNPEATKSFIQSDEILEQERRQSDANQRSAQELARLREERKKTMAHRESRQSQFKTRPMRPSFDSTKTPAPV